MNLLPVCVMMMASIYGTPQTTANGEWFTGKELTVALPNDNLAPIGSYLYVCYRNSCISARRTDTGPFIKGRGIDVSKHLAKLLKFPGLGKVCVIRIE